LGKSNTNYYNGDLDGMNDEAKQSMEEAFQSAVRGRSGAVIIISNPFFSVHAGRVAELALRHHLPTMANDPGVVEAGGLMQYSVDPGATHWRGHCQGAGRAQ